MLDKTITSALLVLRKRLILTGSGSLAHVNALLAERGIDPATLPAAYRGVVQAKRGRYQAGRDNRAAKRSQDPRRCCAPYVPTSAKSDLQGRLSAGASGIGADGGWWVGGKVHASMEPGE